jgi:hypothetical protein
VQLALDCEGKLIDQSLQLERIAFESAKTVATNAIQIHNAAVDRLRCCSRAMTSSARPTTIIEGERLKLDQYRAELQGEETKANVNRTLVEEYRAKIEAQSRSSPVRGAAAGVKAQVDIENAKVQRFGEEIRAYVAGVNGETAKIEAYKINAEAQKTKVDAFEAGARAAGARRGVQGAGRGVPREGRRGRATRRARNWATTRP